MNSAREGVTYSVLVVDDHRISRLGLRAILKGLSCVGEIAEATNGREALEALAQRRYDFVFMDIRMPVLGGIEATKIIRTAYPDVHVIALSVFDEERYLTAMFESGAKGYLLKNTEPDEILDALTSIAAGKIFYSKAVSDTLLDSIKTRQRATIPLSDREKRVLYYLWLGYSSKEMASKLFVSIQTINMERGKLLAKTKSRNAVDLVKFAIDAGIIDELKSNDETRA